MIFVLLGLHPNPFAAQHMIAGAAAGTVEHTAMYPVRAEGHTYVCARGYTSNISYLLAPWKVDTIKTRMQALSHPGQRVSEPGGCTVIGGQITA